MDFLELATAAVQAANGDGPKQDQDTWVYDSHLLEQPVFPAGGQLVVFGIPIVGRMAFDRGSDEQIFPCQRASSKSYRNPWKKRLVAPIKGLLSRSS
ncbi:MAG: hypothetical protein U5L00_04795 [Desulfovermiculus sp.]|nr:hypothetical protein [Desulfovermiculus sp.]